MKKKRILILFILMGSIFLLGACTREKKMKLEQYAVFNSEARLMNGFCLVAEIIHQMHLECLYRRLRIWKKMKMEL